MWNLPAAGDITRLRNQIGSLEGEVRNLRRLLDDAGATAGGPSTTVAAAAATNGKAEKNDESKKMVSA